MCLAFCLHNSIYLIFAPRDTDAWSYCSYTHHCILVARRVLAKIHHWSLLCITSVILIASSTSEERETKYVLLI